MKRKCFFIFCMVLFMIGIVGCAKDIQSDNTAKRFSDVVIGTHQDEVHRVLGEPSGTLSGFYGDIYMLDNGTQIIVYYTDDQKVEHVKIMNKDGTDTLNIE